MSEVKHLEINYKTDELFEDFREFEIKIFIWLKS